MPRYVITELDIIIRVNIIQTVFDMNFRVFGFDLV